MPVQIPEIKRVAPVDVQKGDRVDAKIPSDQQATRAFRDVNDAITDSSKDLIHYMDKVENEAADTEATKRASDYELTFKKKLYGDGQTPGIKYQEGDPVELYNNFDKEMSDEFNRLSSDENFTNKTRDAVLKKLTNTANQLEYQRLSEYGNQQSKYDDNITNNAVDLKKSNLIDATTFVKPGDDQTFSLVDQTIGEIRDLRIKRALKLGSAQLDPNGKSFYIDDNGNPVRVNLNPSADYELKKDLSEGLYNAIDNSIKAGDVETARVLKDRYEQYLDPVKRRSLSDDFHKADVKDESYTIADRIRAEGIDKATADASSPEVREKAIEIFNDGQRRRQQIVDRSSKNAYSRLANYIGDKLRQDPQSFVGPSELEADPVFKNGIDRVTDPKQKKALYDMVVQPKETTDASRERMQKLLFGEDPENDITKMSPEDFNHYLSGMNKDDRKRYSKVYEQMRTETGAEQAQKTKQAGVELRNQLISVGYLKRDEFNRISGQYEKREIDARNELLDYMDKSGSMTPKEMKDYVRNFAVSKARGEAFNPPARPTFQGTKDKPTDFQPPQKDSKGLYGGKTKVQWADEFFKANKRYPNLQTGELDDFIKKQK